MTKTDNFIPKNTESGLDLAGFLTPIELVPTGVQTPSSGTHRFPAVFFVHEKITNSVQQVHLALSRLNAVSPQGPTVFRQDERFGIYQVLLFLEDDETSR